LHLEMIHYEIPKSPMISHILNNPLRSLSNLSIKQPRDNQRKNKYEYTDKKPLNHVNGTEVQYEESCNDSTYLPHNKTPDDKV
jgi:hypothetical protein